MVSVMVQLIECVCFFCWLPPTYHFESTLTGQKNIEKRPPKMILFVEHNFMINLLGVEIISTSSFSSLSFHSGKNVYRHVSAAISSLSKLSDDGTNYQVEIMKRIPLLSPIQNKALK